jgi:hypothetical protein
MRILCAIVGAQPLLMQTRETNSTKRRSVRSEFVGDDNLRNEGLMSKQCPQQPHRGGLVALELDQDLEKSTARHIYLCRPAIETPFLSICPQVQVLGAANSWQ